MSVPVTPAFGPYAILETLETRAFTVTYRAEQRDVGRTVLIKALKPTVSRDSRFAAALTREAAVLGRLDHEGVLRLHDFVRAGEVPHLVLEDARGVALAEVLRAARPDVDQAVAIGLAVARALGHLHEHGVVLRALGASVVAIAPRGRVLLAELSEAVVSGAGDDVETGELGEHPADPSYLAPEQILGEPATSRSDVWSLGVLLHELCAGTRPFDGEDARLLASRIREAAPTPLPETTPPAVARIVARCLAKEPDDRYPDARAVVTALGEALAAISPLPVPVLASRALAAARLGEALPAPATPASPGRRVAASGPDPRRAARELALVLAFILACGAGLRVLADAADSVAPDGVAEPTVAGAGSGDRGHLRVVARPWAEVLIDGELVDVTPVGRPLVVTPGKHFVTFRHPSAPDEQRAVRVLAGQTVFLDVAMRVDRGDAGARAPSPGADAGASP